MFETLAMLPWYVWIGVPLLLVLGRDAKGGDYAEG